MGRKRLYCMNNDLSLGYFEDAINSLVNTIGITEPVDSHDYVSLVKRKNFNECMKKIAQQYGLTLKFNIKIVPKGYRTNKSYYKTSGLVKTNEKGEGIESITAQVLIPNHLPLFGESKLNDIAIDVTIGEECSDEPETFIAVMSHEIAHLLLETLRFPDKNNEIYVDIVPLLLGFHKIVKRGRIVKDVVYNFDNSTTTHTTRYGYINDEQFDFSYKFVSSILKEHLKLKEIISTRIKELDSNSKQLNDTLSEFIKLTNEITEHGKERITSEDGNRLVRFFDVEYLDNVKKHLKVAETLKNIYLNKINSLTHYSQITLEQMNDFENKLSSILRDMKNAKSMIKEDINVLKRNLKSSYKLRRLFFADKQ